MCDIPLLLGRRFVTLSYACGFIFPKFVLVIAVPQSAPIPSSTQSEKEQAVADDQGRNMSLILNNKYMIY